MKSTARRRIRPVAEELEPRILYSADAGAVLLADAPAAAAEVRLLEADLPPAPVPAAPDPQDPDVAPGKAADAAPQTTTRHELIFVDTGIADYQRLLDDLQAGAAPGRQFGVVLLDPGTDGIRQVSDALAAQARPLDAVHLITHGSDGAVKFGNLWLNDANLERHAAEIAGWRDAFAAGADLLLYGCNVAEDAAGRALVDALHALTGADVAASSDATGHAVLGGDWDLEYRIGAIEAHLAIGFEVQNEWYALLDTTLVSYEPPFSSLADQAHELKSDSSRGQTFVHDSAAPTYSVGKVGLVLYRAPDAAAGQTVTVSLRASWNGAVIASGTVSGDSLGTSEAWVDVSLGAMAMLNDNQSYVIRVDSSGSGKIYVGAHDAGSYAGGTLLNDSGSAEASKDLAFRVIDGLGSAPVLDASRTPVLASQQEDSGAPLGAVGTLVSSLVDFASPSGQLDNVVDPDAGAQLGIAVVGADGANGAWWYSLDDGGNWNPLGAVSETSALLLPADGATRVYFQPNANYNGTMASALTFHAWDRTSGAAGGTAFLAASGSMLDQFSNVSYANNNGSLNWSGSWTENDSGGGGASGGRILVDSGELDIRANNAGNWVARAADLSLAASATLSFAFDNQLGIGDSISIQVSGNGGASYATLAGGTFSSILNTGTGTRSFDISSYVSADTRVRFLVETINQKKHLYIDDVQIAWSNIQTGGSSAFSSATDSASLAVTAINDPPVISVPAPQSTSEDTPLVLAAALGNRISAGDVDSGNAPIEATLTATQGTLTLNPLLGAEFRVNTTTSNDQQAPRIAVAADGSYVVAWQSHMGASGHGILARVYNADGSPRSGEIGVNTTTANDQTAPSVAIDASGRFVVAWQHFDAGAATPNWDVYARTFNADGSARSAETRLNTTTSDHQVAPAVAMDAAGNIVVAWQSKGQDHADGKAGIYARLYDVDMVPAGAAFLVNTMTADDQTSPAIARNSASGEFVIAWESKNQDGSGLGVYAQRFSAAGAKAGSEFRVNGATASDQMAPSVAMNAGGDFVVAWQSKGQDNNPPEGGRFGIYAQRYDALGVAQGGEFLVNTVVANDQTAPSVAITDAGTFAIAWTSLGEDHADGKEGVYAQAYAADGTRIAQAFRANTTTLNVQAAPALGATPEGNLIVLWHSAAQDGSGLGVYGQRFKPPGALSFIVGDGTADATMTFRGTVAAISSYLDGLVFTPAPDYNGPASIAISLNDLGNSGAGGALAASALLPINVVAVNDPPTLSLPGAQAAAEDTPIVFSAAGGNAISFGDIDAAPGPLQVTLTAVNGKVKLASLAGLTVTAGADGSGSVTVRGSTADLNAALEGLTYTPNAHYFGADTLAVSVSDLGNTGLGGALGASGGVAITLSSVNDAPVNVLPATQSTPEGTLLILSTANGNAVQLNDVDGFLGIEEVTLASTHGTLKLASTNGLTFSLGDGGGGETRMTFRGTLLKINAALDGLRFTPDAGYAGPAYLEMISSDLGNTGAGTPLGDRDVLRIDVLPNATNAAPIVIVPPNQVTLEETPLVLSSASGNTITVNDDAGGNPLQVTLSVTGGTLTLSTSSGPETLVNSTVLGDQQAARVAMTPSGAYVAVWQSAGQDGSGQGIYGQLFNSEGLALAPEFRVNTTTAADQSAPAIAMDAAGGFVVAWQSKDQDGDRFGIYAQRYDATGVAQGGEFRVNSATAKDQMNPTAAMDAAGNFVIAWQSDVQDGDGFGIYAQRYNAAGVAQGGEFRVNSATAKIQSAPAAAMSASGEFVVLWQSDDQDGDGDGIYAQRYSAAGVAQGAEFRVNTVTYKDQTNAAVAMDDAGNFVVAWQSRDLDYNDGKYGVYAQRYAANGAALGTQFLVNSSTPDEQTNPSVAMDAGGGFVIAWQALDQDYPDHKAGVYAQRYDGAGAAVGGEFLVNATVAGEQTAPAVAMGDNGRFVALWTAKDQDGSGRGIYGQRYFDPRYLAFSAGDGIDDASMTFSGTLEQINDALDGMVFTPAKDFDGNAQLDIVVNDLGNSGSGGAKTTAKDFRITVNPVNDAPTIVVPALQTVAENSPVIFSTAGGNAITIGDVDLGNNKLSVTLSAPVGVLTLASTGGLTFQAGDGIADSTMTFTAKAADLAAALNGLRLDLPAGFTGSAGVQVSVNDQGNSGVGGVLAAAASALVDVVPDAVNQAPRITIPAPQYTPQDTPLTISMATSNGVSVADDSGSLPVTVTLTVTNGTVSLSSATGPEARVNTWVTSNQDSARLAMMPNGDYVVAWRSNGQDGSGTGVYAQRYNAAGFAIGPEFRVNATTANNQWAPSVAVNSAGQFVVAWVSDSQDGSGRGVYVQRFDAAAVPLGGEALVNTEIAGDQDTPSVAIADSGAFVVAWESADAEHEGIFAQLFDANGQQAGGEFQVNDTGTGHQTLPDVAMDAAGNFVAVWQGEDASSDGIYARRFNAAGTALGGDVLVNSTLAGSQATPAVATNASGSFVVAWQGPEPGGGGVGTGIFAQRFDNSGAAVGGELLVNDTAAGNQVLPDVAINAAGEFVVAWQGTDGSGDGVFAQVYRADGSRLGRETLVNTTTTGDQEAPSVGMAADGRYAAAWTSDNLDASGTGIAAQRMLRGDELTLSAGTGVNDVLVTMTGTLAHINAALDGLRFAPPAGFNGVATIRVDVNDLGSTGSGGALAAQATFDIAVGKAPLMDLDANDSAGVPGSGFQRTFVPGLGPVPATDVDATLVDATSGNLASMTVTITNLLDAGFETLGFSTAGTGIVGNYNAAAGVLSLTGSNSVANYQKVLRTITYNNTAAAPTAVDRQISFVAWDGGFYSNVSVATIRYPGANQAPVAASDGYAVAEDGVLAVPAPGVLGNDSDANSDPLSASLVSTTVNGVLVLNADGSFTYTPNANFTGGDSFSYRAWDGTAYSAPASVTISVSAVNDAPGGSNATIALAENGVHVFSAADFGFFDPDDTPANGMVAVQISSLPGAGVLANDGVAVAAGQLVSRADIDAGKLVFTPAAHANGIGYASFTFQVQDDGGTAAGGIHLDPTPNTLTFDVAPLNSAPAGADGSVSTLEDIPYLFMLADFGFSDPNDAAANALLAVRVASLPGSGTLANDGVAVSAGQFVSAADIAAGKLVFTPPPDASGTPYASFTFQVQDDGGTGGGGADLDPAARTLVLKVAPVNDPPQGADRTVSLAEDGSYTFSATDFGFTDPRDTPAGALLAVRIATVPVAGTLSLGGAPVAAGQFVAAADIDAGLLRFTPAANANGTGYASFTFRVQDDGGTAGGGADLDLVARTLTLDVTPVNDAPVNGVPGAQSTTLNTALVFSGANGNRISVADIDAASGVLQLSLATPDGTLSLATIAGLSFSSGSGSNDAAMTFSGSLAALNTALDGLVFTPTFNFSGVTSLDVTSSDLGNTGAGGAKTDFDPILINVAFVNSAPDLAGANDLLPTLEDAASDAGTLVSALVAGMQSDANAGALQGIAVIAVDETRGDWQFTTDGGTTWNPLAGAAPGAAVLLRADAATSVRFVADANWHGAVTNGITFRAWDQTSGIAGGTADTAVNGGSSAFSSASASASIDVLPVNDAPAGADRTVVMSEDGAYAFGLADFGLSDPRDTPADALLAVRIASLPAAGSLTLSGAAVSAGQFIAVADIAAGNLLFTPAANANGAGHAAFTFRVQDDGGTSNGGADLDLTPRTMTLDVTPVNDAPVAVGSATLAAVAEDALSPAGASVGALFGGSFTDPADAANPAHGQLAGVAVRGQSVIAAQGRWQYSTDGGGSWSNFGAISDANALSIGINDRLRFLPAADFNGTPTSLSLRLIDNSTLVAGGVTISVSAHGGATPFSDAVVSAVTAVTAVNDAPSGADNTVTTLEDAAYAFSVADFGFFDGADSPVNGLLTVRIATLPAAGSLTLSGVAVTPGQFVSAADIDAGNLVFLPGANDNGAGYASFTFRVQDDGGTSNGGIDLDAAARTMTLDVTPVNDAPAGADATLGLLEDAPHVFVAADFGFSDAGDSPANALLAVRFVSLPAVGSLTLSGAAVTAGQLVSAADIAAGNLVYAPPANLNGLSVAAFTFRVQDDGGSANGGISLDPVARTIAIDLAPVNDAPLRTSGSVSDLVLPEDYGLASLGFAGLGHAPGGGGDEAGQSLTYSVTALPDAALGMVLLADGTTPVTLGVYSLADIQGMQFRTAPGATGGPSSFSFTVQDDGGSANGGVDSHTETLDISVVPISHAPAGADNSVATLEDQPYAFGSADFGFADPDDAPANALLAVKIAALPGNGSLTLAGGAVVAGQSVSAADIAAGNLVFTPDADANGAGYASFTFQVQDDGGSLFGGADLDPVARSMAIDVTPVNDAPSGADNTVAVLEDGAHAFALADFGFADAGDTPADALLSVRIESLPGAGSLTLSGVAVTAGQSVAATEIAAGNLVFTPAANASGAGYASFTFRAQDDGGSANGGADLDAVLRTLSVDVIPVNDAPAGAGNTLTVLEDATYVFGVADFGFSDAGDAPANALLEVLIDMLPAAGSLTLSGVAVTAGQAVSAADVAAGNLAFAPDADASGAAHASFVFRVRDDGGTFNGGAGLDATPKTMTIDVTPVNDAPGGADRTVTTFEDQPYAFGSADFGFADPVDAPANALLAVKITSLPGNGSLTLSGGAVAAGQFVSAADIAAGNLVFTPDANASGAGFAFFTFQVQDDGGSAGGGVDLDPTPRMMIVDVVAVNDAPHGADISVSTLEDTAYTFSTTDFGFADPDDAPANALLAVRIDTLPAAGSLTLSGAAFTAGQFIAAADVAAGNLRFTPGANAHGAGYAAFTFRLQDDGGVAGGGNDLDSTPRSMNLNVISVNDAPAGADGTVSTLEGTAYVFSQADFGFSDASDVLANAFGAVNIATLPGAGALALNGAAVTASQWISVADIALGRLVFTPDAGTSGANYASFKFLVRDGGGSANGGQDVDATPRTLSVNVVATGAPPVVVVTPPVVPPVVPPAPPPVVPPVIAPGAPPAGAAPATAATPADPALSGSSSAPDAAGPAGRTTASPGADSAASAGAQTGEALPVEASSSPALSGGAGQATESTTGGWFLQKLRSVLATFVTPQTEAPSIQVGIASALQEAGFARALDGVRGDVQEETRQEQRFIASAIVGSTTLSIGYVMWLLRSGTLLASLLSSLPAWRTLDPFPVLSRTDDEDDEEDDESLESMLAGSQARSAGDAETQEGRT